MDPYKVLGVSPNDDEETIKKAYRSLVKKYHPDRYANSPLAEQANEKLKEINLAYDIITGKAQNTSQGGYTQQGYGGYSGYGGYNTQNFEVSFRSVRTLITLRMLDAAEQMLEKLPRTAEWHFLKGIICQSRGWYDNASSHFDTAVQMEPDNPEYQNAKYNYAQRAGGFQSRMINISPVAVCASAFCLSQICCGGRFIPCLCWC